jgi:hypothetical protein
MTGDTLAIDGMGGAVARRAASEEAEGRAELATKLRQQCRTLVGFTEYRYARYRTSLHHKLVAEQLEALHIAFMPELELRFKQSGQFLVQFLRGLLAGATQNSDETFRARGDHRAAAAASERCRDGQEQLREPVAGNIAAEIEQVRTDAALAQVFHNLQRVERNNRSSFDAITTWPFRSFANSGPPFGRSCPGMDPDTPSSTVTPQ